MSGKYYPGQPVLIEFDVIDRDGDLVDPFDGTLYIREPCGDLTTVVFGDLDNPAVGEYEYVFYTDFDSSPGRWTYAFNAVDSNSNQYAYDEGYFILLRSQVEPT